MRVNAPAGWLSFLQLSVSGKLKEKLKMQELFYRDGCLGVEHGGAVKKSLSFGHSVSLSTGGLLSSSFIPTDKYKHFGP